MAIYTLHYVLFPVAKQTNIHLLLDETFGLLWVPQQRDSPANHSAPLAKDLIFGSSSHQETKFIYTHTIIFITALVAYFISTNESLAKADKTDDHRRYLLNSLASAFVFYSLYVYLVNTASSFRLESMPFALKCIHTIVIGSLVTGLSWSSLVISSISEAFISKFCLQCSKSIGAMYQFITHLMVGSLSLAFASVSLCEIYLASSAINNSSLGYINLSVAFALLALIIEIICLHCLTIGPRDESSTSYDVEKNRHLNKFRATRLSLSTPQRIASSSMVSLYSLSCAKSKSLDGNSLSISSDRIKQNNLGEVTCSTEEDEWDNSVDLFYVYPGLYPVHNHESARSEPTKRKVSPVKGTADAYDKDKFALYDNYGVEDKAMKQRKEPHPTQVSRVITADQGPTNLTTFEILVKDNWPFVEQFVLLVLIGTVYQANQLCYMTDYLYFLTHRSPMPFRLAILNAAHPVLRPSGAGDYLATANTTGVVWAELIGASHLVQCSARILCLHHTNRIVLRFGLRKTLLVVLVISATIPIQFILNYSLLYLTNFTTLTQIILVMSQLVAIQVQMGLVTAVADFIINESALNYSQVVAKHHQSMGADTRGAGRRGHSDHGTILGILRGAYELLGAALASAISLLYNPHATGRISTGDQVTELGRFAVAILPFTTLIFLCGSLLIRRHKLSKAKEIKPSGNH